MRVIQRNLRHFTKRLFFTTNIFQTTFSQLTSLQLTIPQPTVNQLRQFFNMTIYQRDSSSTNFFSMTRQFINRQFFNLFLERQFINRLFFNFVFERQFINRLFAILYSKDNSSNDYFSKITNHFLVIVHFRFCF